VGLEAATAAAQSEAEDAGTSAAESSAEQVEAERLAAQARLAELEQQEASAELQATHTYLAALRATHYCQPLPELRPLLFPEHLWEYVLDTLKPTVGPAWKAWIAAAVPGRLEEVMGEIAGIDISKENAARELEAPYLRAQCYAHLGVYGHPDPNNAPTIKGYSYDIELNDKTPVRSKMRRVSNLESCYLWHRLRQLEDKNYIRKSTSEYNSPPVLVPYADNIRAFLTEHEDDAITHMWQEKYSAKVLKFYRLTNDFRELNARSKLEKWPLPFITEILDRMKGSDRYSTGDMADAFFLCPLTEKSREYTGFLTVHGNYEYLVMPQGHKSAACHFGRMVYEVFKPMRDAGRELGVYQDDTSNFADDFLSHLQVQEGQYKIMMANSLTFKASKAHLNYKSQRILGHIMSKHGRTVDPERRKAILLLAVPKTLTHLQSVLGMAQHCREYIPSMSNVIEPMQRLCKKGVDIEEEWGPLQDASFTALKEALTMAPVLAIPDLQRPFRVHVDTCKVERGVGAVLLQRDEHIWATEQREHWRPVAY
jgi:DNA-binding MarR family transcriptional regulator